MESVAKAATIHHDQSSSDTNSSEENDQQTPTNDDNAGIGRSYECTFCKRGFTNAQALGGHMNIHRKDKAKAKAKQKSDHHNHENSSASRKFSPEGYFGPRFYGTTNASISSIDQQRHFYMTSGAAQMNYHQIYFPVSNPSYQHAYYHHGGEQSMEISPRASPFEEIDATLSLKIGPANSNGEDEELGGGRKRNRNDEEIDLELRLGHHDP